MSEVKFCRYAHKLATNEVYQNCGMTVLAEFKGGHRYRGGYGFDDRPLTAEEWCAILKNTGGGYSAPSAKMWLVTGTKSQLRVVNDMSLGGFINFLKEMNVPVVEANVPKTPYAAYTIYPTKELRDKVRSIKMGAYFTKDPYYLDW